MIRFLSIAVACVALGCGDAKKGETPKVDNDAASKGKGADTKKAMEDKNKEGAKTGASPQGKTGTAPD